MKTLLKWMDGNRNSDFFCDLISWIQALKRENDFEEISGIMFSDWHSDTLWFSANFAKSGICCQICQASSCRRYLWDWLFPDKPCPQLRCDHQNRLHHPQRKPSFMASLLAGDLAATATITAAPTALVVRGVSPLLPLLLRLRPLTMPWPSPTPTYISSVCHHGRGRKPVSCCLYQS